MHMRGTDLNPMPQRPPTAEQDHERRLQLLIRRLPQRLQNAISWLRRPGARWVRIPTGLLLVLAGLLAVLPVFALWMLPLGLVLLAEDVKPVRRATGRVLAWIEHRRPHWMGLPQASNHQPCLSGKETS